MTAFAMSQLERATVKHGESYCVSWFLLCVMTGAITGYYAFRLLVVMLVGENVDAISQLTSSLVGVGLGALLGSFLDYTLSKAHTWASEQTVLDSCRALVIVGNMCT